MFLSILQKTILISLGFTLQMTFSWKKAVPHGWIPSSILTACCCGTGGRWDVALAAATAEPVGRWKVTRHLTSIRLWWILWASQARAFHAGSNVTASHKANTNPITTSLKCHPQRPLTKCNYVHCSVPVICENIYCDLPEWQKLTSQPSTGSGGFLFCSLSLNCMFYLHCIAWHYLSHTSISTKLNKPTNLLKARYNLAAQKWKSHLWYKSALLFW